MPASLRALTAKADRPPDRPASAVLSEFLALTLDALVRSPVQTAVRAAPARRPARKPASPAFDSVHDQWLYAVRSPDGTMHGPATELAQFAEQVRTWQRPVAVETAAPFRLCFRLEEPPSNGEDGIFTGQDARWIVRYLLRSRTMPASSSRLPMPGRCGGRTPRS